ncbi:helix-turn-helix domain-containing protein [Mycolicibacterium elephantis]
MTFSKFGWYWSLATATDLTDTEFRVLVLLANYADGKTGKRAYPSATTLAKQMGKSDKTVRRALAALVAKGRLIKTERPGATAEYQLVTLDTQMSRVTDEHPGHSDVQGPAGTLDKSAPTLDTAMSTHPGHPDVHRSDQLTDPDNRSGSGSDQFRAEDIPNGDVQPGEDQDETGHESRSLAVGGRTEAPGNGASGQGRQGPSLKETAESSAAEHRPVGLQPPTAIGSPFDDPFGNEPAWLAESRAREERDVRCQEPATAGGPPASAWD